MDSTVTLYEPDNSLKKNWLSVYVEIFDELKKSRWLIYQLFKRQFFAAYKQSFMGVLWRFVMPLLSVATFILLNRSGVFNIGNIDMPYPIYALTGVTFWQIFATGVLVGANSLIVSTSMITKINFSKKSLVIASIAQAFLNFIIQLVLVAMAFSFYRILPSRGAFLIPLVIIPLMLFTIGIGLILAIFNAIMRDVGTSLSMAITFLMFLTPVLYPKPKIGFLSNITKYNPLYYMISAGRDVIFTGTISEPKGFIISVLASLFTFIICLRLFHLTETKITERI
jgi:lipopolysaccharide transport system permease protein